MTFQNRVNHMDIEEVVCAPRSPWQNPYCERLVGSIRRECLDHVIVINERHPRRVLRFYSDYYLNARTHLALERKRMRHQVTGGDTCPTTRRLAD